MEFWRTVPVSVDPHTGTVLSLNSKTRRALAFGNIFVLCAYTTFLGTRCISAYMDEASRTDERVLLEYFFGSSFMPIMYQAVLTFQRRPFLAFVKTYRKSLEHVWGERLKLY